MRLANVNEQLAATSVADGVSQSQLDGFRELRRNALVTRRDWEQAVQSAEAIVRQSRRSVVAPESESAPEGDGESADLGEQMDQAHDQQQLIELEAATPSRAAASAGRDGSRGGETSRGSGAG